MSKNSKIILAGVVIFVAILSILLMSAPTLSSTELTIEELLKQDEQLQGKYVTTQGLLIEETIEWNADKIELTFQIEDENGQTLSVYHHGVIPDNFSDGIIVILKGFLQEDGIFNAEKIQTQCPSKYESVDRANYDIELHKEILNSSNE